LRSGSPDHPLVGARTNRQPCHAEPPPACNEDMQTVREFLANIPSLGHYDIDISKSAVRFRTRHMFGLGPVRGTFAIRSGSADLAEPLGESVIRAEIDSASFTTGNPQRDAIVRSYRLLACDQFPAITFRDGRVHAGGAAISGELTVRGVTRPVTLTVGQVARSGEYLTVTAATRIDRSEFGVTAMRGLAGRYLDLTLEVRCVHK
jgi:polyisoprenoid-binding protein YceI